MDRTFKIGYLETPTSAPGNLSVTGLGFQPDCVLFIVGNLSVGSPLALEPTVSRGAMTGSEQFAEMFGCSSSGGWETVRGKTDTLCIALYDAWGNPLALASRVSLDSDGFTLDFSTIDGNPWLVLWAAFGGGFSKAAYDVRGGFYPPATQTVFKNLGICFDLAIFLSTGFTTAGDQLEYGAGPVSTSDGAAGFLDTGQAGVLSGVLRDRSFFRNLASGALLRLPDNTGVSMLRQATPARAYNGYQSLETRATSLFDAYCYSVLAVAGLRCHVQVVTSPGVTGTVDYTQPGFQPIGLILCSAGRAASPSYQSQFQLYVGLADGVSNLTFGFTANTFVFSGTTYNAALSQVDLARCMSCWPTVGNNTPTLQVHLEQFLTNGYRLDWETVPSPAEIVAVTAFAPRPSFGAAVLGPIVGRQ